MWKSLIIPLALLFGCHQNKKTTLELTLNLVSPGTEINIIEYNRLNYDADTLASLKLPKSGTAEFELAIDKPVFISLIVGDYEINQTTLISPGDHMLIHDSLFGNQKGLVFQGDAANENNYIRSVQLSLNSFHQKNPAFWQMDFNSFKYQLDSIQYRVDELNNQYFAETTNNALEQILPLNLISLKQQYQLINAKSDEVISHPDFFFFDLNFDRSFYDFKYLIYSMVLDLYHRKKFIEPADNDTTGRKDLPVITQNQIDSTQNLPAYINEYLTTKNLLYWLGTEGLSISTLEIFQNKLPTIKNEQYVTVINQTLAEWEQLSPGKPAPEITGVSYLGDTIRLSDLRGKLIYLDVWATWCGPCIKHFKSYPQLQQSISDTSKVQFVFLSHDENLVTWKKFIETKSAPKGLHLFQISDSTHSDVHEAYRIWGAGRSILIDKFGKIIDTNAPVADSPNLASIIDENI